MLRHHLGVFLRHTCLHEQMSTILYDKRPAHNLRTDIKELGYHSLTIMRQAEDVPDGRNEVAVLLLCVFRHTHNHQQKDHKENHHAYYQVRLYENAQVGVSHHGILGLAELLACIGVKRIEARLNEVHCYIHAQQRPDGIERLGKVKAPCSRLFGAHRQDVRVAARLKERQAAGKYKIGQQERIIAACVLGREEHKRAYGIKQQPHEHACLIRIFAYEYGSGKCHGKIAAIEGYLNQGAVGDAHPEYL